MKNLINLGKALNKTEQKKINGGKYPPGYGVFRCYFDGVYVGCSLTSIGCQLFGVGTVAYHNSTCL